MPPKRKAGGGAAPAPAPKARKTSETKKTPKPSASKPGLTPIEVQTAVAKPTCIVLLAHGAGGNSKSPNMVRYVQILQTLAHVVTFDFPGNRLDSYTELHLSAAEQASARFPDLPLFLSGQSMGCRGCVNVVNYLNLRDQMEIKLPTFKGLIMFSYPLVPLPHPPKDEKQKHLREPPLLELSENTKMLFCSGTRDPFINKDPSVLSKLLPKMKAQTSLHILDGADHSLKGKAQKDLDKDMLTVIRKFILASV